MRCFIALFVITMLLGVAFGRFAEPEPVCKGNDPSEEVTVSTQPTTTQPTTTQPTTTQPTTTQPTTTQPTTTTTPLTTTSLPAKRAEGETERHGFFVDRTLVQKLPSSVKTFQPKIESQSAEVVITNSAPEGAPAEYPDRFVWQSVNPDGDDPDNQPDIVQDRIFYPIVLAVPSRIGKNSSPRGIFSIQLENTGADFDDSAESEIKFVFVDPSREEGNELCAPDVINSDGVTRQPVVIPQGCQYVAGLEGICTDPSEGACDSQAEAEGGCNCDEGACTFETKVDNNCYYQVRPFIEDKRSEENTYFKSNPGYLVIGAKSEDFQGPVTVHINWCSNPDNCRFWDSNCDEF